MPKFLKAVAGILAFFAILLAALAFFSMRLVKKSLPNTQGTLSLAGLKDEVIVHRDEFGVPHVLASNEDDLWRAAGFVAAQDRLWQMDLSRRAVRGTLAEIFGAEALPRDRFLRTWGFHRVSQQIAASLSPESRAMVSAYVAGVNEFIRTHADKLPVEFSILGYKPDLWEIEDSIGFSRIMGFRLCSSWFFEAALGEIAEKLGTGMALELFPAVLDQTPVIVSDLPAGLSPALPEFRRTAEATRIQLGIPPGVMGSNSWVAGAAKSVSGKPILANDPHLGLSLPVIWYEMHLTAGALDVTGVTFAGAPGVVIGHNRAIAWGFTNGMADDLDFYQERINPQNEDEYWNGTEWKRMTVMQEFIPVKGEDPQPFKIRLTERGPIVNNVHEAVKSDSTALSMRWTGHAVSDELRAISALNHAGNWQQFQEAMRHFRVPCQNVIYADTAGNIGYWACGAIPIRRDGKGFLPYRGWEKEGEWTGFIPFEEMPHAFNPPQAFIATANNQMFTAKYPYYISNAWEPSSRIERITELLQSSEKASVDFFAEMHGDVVSKHAQYVLPRMLQLFDAPPDSSIADTALSEEERNARALLQQWNGAETHDSVPAAIFNVWALEFLQSITKDELGDTLFKSYTAWSGLATRALEHFVNVPASPWFDDVHTAGVESAHLIARRSFRNALAFLKHRFGELMGDWQWGRLHQLTLEHTLGQRKPLDYVLNAGPLAMGGSANTINKSEYRLHSPYGAEVGPSMRMIVDMSAPQRTLMVLPGGQSGQPFSPHYKDQVELWRQGHYREVTMEQEQIAAGGRQVMRLVPATTGGK